MENIELGRFLNEMARFSALSLCVRTLRSTAPASKNEGPAHRAARRVAQTILPRKTTKIEPKIATKSIEVGRPGYVEAPKSIEVGRLWPDEAAKSSEVGRTRPVGSSWHDEQALSKAELPKLGKVGKLGRPRWTTSL